MFPATKNRALGLVSLFPPVTTGVAKSPRTLNNNLFNFSIECAVNVWWLNINRHLSSHFACPLQTRQIMENEMQRTHVLDVMSNKCVCMHERVWKPPSTWQRRLTCVSTCPHVHLDRAHLWTTPSMLFYDWSSTGSELPNTCTINHQPTPVDIT